MVNPRDFFESAPNKQTAVPFTVVLDGLDSQEICMDPGLVKTLQLPEDVKVQRVAKGTSYPISIGSFPLVMKGTAECDGYLLKPEGNRVQFFAAAAYAAIFGGQEPVEGQKILIGGNPIGCVLIEKDTTFQFVAGDFPATAGMVLYENPSDPDGYRVLSALDFLKRHLILR